MHNIQFKKRSMNYLQVPNWVFNTFTKEHPVVRTIKIPKIKVPYVPVFNPIN